MKAAVITLHTVCNYGTMLQTYATQEKLKEYFESVTFIDYRRKDTYGIERLRTYSKGNIIRGMVALPTLIYWRQVFGKFLKQYINRTKEIYLTDKSFNNFRSDADVYFVGSDQVWNTGWNKGVILPFYLSFVPANKPKYSYAASFGLEKIEDQYVIETQEYIKRFKKITVREQSGVKILNEQYGYSNAEQILDPTLAMNAEFWRKLAPRSKIKENYLLLYNLNRSSELDEYAQKLSETTGLKLYRLCTRFDQIIRNGKSIVIPPVFEFITLIDNAKIVLTDSFHATAFSMNLNTEPICVYPKNYSGRISEFLRLVESEQRHIESFEDFDVVNRHVDFGRVNAILEKEREKIDVFLKEVSQNV